MGVKKSAYYQHPAAIVDAKQIGKDTRIWAFSHIEKNVKIGKNCNIGEGCYIESGVKIGNNVTLKNNVCLWEGLSIEDNVFIGPHAAFTNDIYPRSKVYRPRVRTVIKEGASIGANATILCGISIGQYVMVGAGAVVTRDIPDYSLVYGNPASLMGYVCACGCRLEMRKKEAACNCGIKYCLKEEGNLKQIKRK